MKKLKEINLNRLVYVLTVFAVIGWVSFRFAAIGSENSRHVFNATRVAEEIGAPVEVIEVSRQTDVLREPLFVKNNRAYVSGARIDKFKAGQKVGNGEIISVGRNIDLDSGMYVIRTRGVTNGMNYVEAKGTGYFVPVYAINNGTVMVSVDGVAQMRQIVVDAEDSETARISGGLTDGDIVILSKVQAGNKVKVQNQNNI